MLLLLLWSRLRSLVAAAAAPLINPHVVITVSRSAAAAAAVQSQLQVLPTATVWVADTGAGLLGVWSCLLQRTVDSCSTAVPVVGSWQLK